MFGALATYGLIYGMLRGLSDTSLSDTSSVAVALFLLVGICLAAYVRTARFKSLTLFWRLIFPVTLLGLVLTPLSGNAGAGLAAPIAQTGYLLFESLVWIILFDNIATRYQLTNRETEVLELLAAGKSGPQISETLVLSKATVKTHTYNIYKKLEVHTRAELLAFVQNFR